MIRRDASASLVLYLELMVVGLVWELQVWRSVVLMQPELAPTQWVRWWPEPEPEPVWVEQAV